MSQQFPSKRRGEARKKKKAREKQSRCYLEHLIEKKNITFRIKTES